MNNYKRLCFILFTGCMAWIPIAAQSDCMEKEKELGPPIRSENLARIVDPETFIETIYKIEIYKEGEVQHIIKTDTVYSYDPETYDPILEITHTYKIDPIEPDTVVEMKDKKIYYTEENDCLRIYKIGEFYEKKPKQND